MKKILLALYILLMVVCSTSTSRAQAAEAAQLALNIEKLAQLKSILTSLKKGYDIVSKGYGTIKSLTEGNFNIHKVFLDGLMQDSHS
jgi:preprotein translocase subunit YajC